jgi:hypothetical protein
VREEPAGQPLAPPLAAGPHIADAAGRGARTRAPPPCPYFVRWQSTPTSLPLLNAPRLPMHAARRGSNPHHVTQAPASGGGSVWARRGRPAARGRQLRATRSTHSTEGRPFLAHRRPSSLAPARIAPARIASARIAAMPAAMPEYAWLFGVVRTVGGGHALLWAPAGAAHALSFLPSGYLCRVWLRLRHGCVVGGARAGRALPAYSSPLPRRRRAAAAPARPVGQRILESQPPRAAGGRAAACRAAGPTRGNRAKTTEPLATSRGLARPPAAAPTAADFSLSHPFFRCQRCRQCVRHVRWRQNS